MADITAFVSREHAVVCYFGEECAEKLTVTQQVIERKRQSDSFDLMAHWQPSDRSKPSNRSRQEDRACSCQ